MSEIKKVILLAAAADAQRDDLKKLLEQGGHVVLVCENADDGMALAKAHELDIVVLDITVPALNGYSFLESLTNDVVLAKVPAIVLMVGGEADIDANKNITLGVKDYIIKSGKTSSDVATKLLPFIGRESGNPLQSEGFKILVVEDDNFLRDLLARKLGQENCQFIAAIDGENALKIIDDEKPSIILLDLILPGIDGFEVLTKIKQNPVVKDVPVVILSNLGQDSDIQKAKELGADDFLIKANFSIDEVIAKIKELIGK